LPTTPQGQQQQQRTFDVLRKPDIFKSYRHPMKRAFQPDVWPRKQTKRQAQTIKLAVARNRWFESISLQRRANFGS